MDCAPLPSGEEQPVRALIDFDQDPVRPDVLYDEQSGLSLICGSGALLAGDNDAKALFSSTQIYGALGCPFIAFLLGCIIRELCATALTDYPGAIHECGIGFVGLMGVRFVIPTGRITRCPGSFVRHDRFIWCYYGAVYGNLKGQFG